MEVERPENADDVWEVADDCVELSVEAIDALASLLISLEEANGSDADAAKT